MIDEMKEFKQYYESGKNILSEKSRLKHFAAGRVLTIAARYFWWHDPETGKMEDKQKIEHIKKKLDAFYKRITIDAYEALCVKPIKVIENIKEEKKSRKRYNKDYLEQKQHYFTFYSAIANAVNEGKLKEGGVKLTGEEILYILKLTDYGSQKRSSNMQPVLALKLISYYKFAKEHEMLLADGYLPIVNESINAWLASKNIWQKTVDEVWLKDRDNFNFISVENVHRSVRYKIDFDVIKSDIKISDDDAEKLNKLADDGSLKEGYYSSPLK